MITSPVSACATDADIAALGIARNRALIEAVEIYHRAGGDS